MRLADKFKCKVLDIEFYTYNERVYRDTPDELGNKDFRKADFQRGKKSDKYTRKKIQYVYRCKWIIGTDKCYDFGMAYDQKRANEPKNKAKTKLSYTFYAYNFYQMKSQGIQQTQLPFAPSGVAVDTRHKCQLVALQSSRALEKAGHCASTFQYPTELASKFRGHPMPKPQQCRHRW